MCRVELGELSGCCLDIICATYYIVQESKREGGGERDREVRRQREKRKGAKTPGGGLGSKSVRARVWVSRWNAHDSMERQSGTHILRVGRAEDGKVQLDIRWPASVRLIAGRAGAGGPDVRLGLLLEPAEGANGGAARLLLADPARHHRGRAGCAGHFGARCV